MILRGNEILTYSKGHTYNEGMTLAICQNFVSAQYHEIKLTEFYQILYMNFTKFCICIHTDNIYHLSQVYRELWPLINVRISFLFNILSTN